MLTIEQLKQFGANTDEGIARCAGMEALYLRLVKMIPAEKSFEILKTALEANDLDEAFTAAHTLKGVLGNLSLTPMYDICADMTEKLRQRTAMDYSSQLNELLDKKAQLDAICAE